MKSFRQYLTESTRQYHFRIKTVIDPTEEFMSTLEKFLQKYDLVDLDGPHRSIIQKTPLDFQDIENKEVYIIDVILGRPISAYVLLQEIRYIWNISEKYIVVRSDNDPTEVETERLNALRDMEEKAEKMGYERRSLLSTSPNYLKGEMGIDGSDYYGNKYNNTLTAYLAKVASERQNNKIIPDDALSDHDGTKPLKTDNFNDDIRGAPLIHPWWEASKDSKIPETNFSVSYTGNFDDDKKTYAGVFRHPKTSKEKEINVTTNAVRGD
ncbi:MAG: hypothetical protein WC284_13655 [Candidimonas sp.]